MMFWDLFGDLSGMFRIVRERRETYTVELSVTVYFLDNSGRFTYPVGMSCSCSALSISRKMLPSEIVINRCTSFAGTLYTVFKRLYQPSGLEDSSVLE